MGATTDVHGPEDVRAGNSGEVRQVGSVPGFETGDEMRPLV